MLIEGLPPDSALGRSVGSIWTPADVLLTEVLNTLRHANWQRSGRKGGKPDPISLDRLAAEQQARMDVEDTDRRLLEQQAREQARREDARGD